MGILFYDIGCVGCMEKICLPAFETHTAGYVQA